MEIKLSSYAKNNIGEIAGPITLEKFNNNDGTMVTIVCITYKHEGFIAQALESFLMQKTNFKFKVFVGEDCGPDKTAQIVRQYAAKYPDIIVPFIREKNMGAQRNLIDLCQRATSPYIAFCEGDDYWIDEYKLQKQFDFMEKEPFLGSCFARAEIDAPKDWFLRKFYIEDETGKLTIPNSDPSYGWQFKKNKYLYGNSFVSVTACHTSTMFIRWNYDIEIPEWYFNGMIGDISIFLLQLGDQKTLYIHNIVSVYRRSDVGIWMSSDIDSHFLKTRVSYMNIWGNFLRYIEDNNLTKYSKIAIENRIKLEVYNYLNTSIKKGELEKNLQLLINDYPKELAVAINAYLSFYRDSRLLIKTIGWECYKVIVYNKYYRNALKCTKIFCKLEKIKKYLKNKTKSLVSFMCYWLYSLVPKNKSRWCFIGFHKNTYMDNSKYLYEYVLENHPEIEAYWLTLSDDIFNELKKKGMPVKKMRTWECIKCLSSSEVLVIDHYRKSDIDNYSGFNNRLKVVQLWHGIGFKNMGNGKKMLTTIPGVQYSNDILSSKSDNFFVKLKKHIKYFRKAYFRELFEEYFLFVVPGQAQIDMLAKNWNIPRENVFICGNSRNIKLYNNDKSTKKQINIIYAPTFRWKYKNEVAMIDRFLNELPKIDTLLKKYNAILTIRLHPHTWRNHDKKILESIRSYNNIYLDHNKDIYENLNEYDVMVSDYSSITLDFAMIDKPVVFLCDDYEEYLTEDYGFAIDFFKNIPGLKAESWEEVLKYIEEYIKNPHKESKLRKNICSYFFDVNSNDINNSERIVKEVKRRLGIK